MKFFLFIILFFSQNTFAFGVMINLNSKQAKIAMQYLNSEKGVLLKKNGGKFKYLPIKKLRKEYGIEKEGMLSKFSIIHEDDEDTYHISINGTSVDLDKIYFQYGHDIHTWVRLASKITPNFYRNRENSTYYVYKKKELKDIPFQREFPNLVKVGTIRVIRSSSGSMEMFEDEEDYEFNHGVVFKKMRQLN